MLVVANETVVGEPLLDRIRERAARSPASFLIICPQSDPTPRRHPEAERRLRRALAILRGEGIDAHGQVSHPDPYTAAMQAVHDERVDEIIVSTFAAERSPLAARRTSSQRLHNDASCPSSTCRSAEEVGRPDDRARRSAPRAARREPELARRRATLGMLLFIASEIMLFGSFFTAYFFIRVVNDAPAWPPQGFHLPVFVAGVNTAILLTSSFTMHWALQSIKRGNRAGLQAGLVLTLALGLDVPAHPGARVLTDRLRAARQRFGSVFYGLTGLHGAHVFVGLTLLMFATIRAFRGHFTAEHHHGVEIPGIYWHFVDVMWIVVYTTIYIL